MVLGTIGAISQGCAMVFPDYGFNAISTLSAVEAEKCTTLYGVPTMFQAVMNEQMRHPHVVSTLKKGVIAGAVATPEFMTRIINELGIKHTVNAYGMTEVSPVATMTKFEEEFEKQVSTVGTPLPNTEIKLVDENNVTVPLGEAGEICFRGYLVMKEYWENEEATRQTIDSNRWLHTGYLGIFDHDMYLKIVGRKHDHQRRRERVPI
jgi:fatty-acyl-CoA synthase